MRRRNLISAPDAAFTTASSEPAGGTAMTGGAGSAMDPDEDGASAHRGLGSPTSRPREGDGRRAGTADLTTVAPESPAVVDPSAPAPPVIAAAPSAPASRPYPHSRDAPLASHPLGRYPLAKPGYRAE
jgi:hypothetical protein